MRPPTALRSLALALVVAAGLALTACGLVAGERLTVLPSDDGAAGAAASATPSAPAASTVPGPPSEAPSADGVTDCAGAPVTLSGGDLDVTLRGDCPAVTVSGTDLDIDTVAAAVGSLQLGGDRNELDAATVETLSIGGQDNEIEAVEIGSLAVNGDRNEIGVDTRVGAVTVAGNDNRILAPERGAVTDSGQRNTIAAP